VSDLTSRAADRRTFRSARSVLAGRNGRPSIADIAYLAYAGGLAVLIAGAPLVRLAVIGLLTPEAFTALGQDRFGVGASIVAALAVLLVASGGSVRGPVVPRPSAVQFLADSPLPRRMTLRRPFVLSSLALVVGGFLIGGIVAISRLIGVDGGAASDDAGSGDPATPATVTAGTDPQYTISADGDSASVSILMLGGPPPTAETVIPFLVGVVAFTVFLAVVWLAAQRRARGVVWGLAGAAVLTSAIALLTPSVLAFTPWGWIGLLWAQLVGGVVGPVEAGGSFAFVAGSALWWPAVALVLVALAVFAVPRLLDGLRSADLLEQSRRWQSVAVLVQTGDAAGAAGHLRPPPSRGRRIHLPMPRSLALAAVLRSIVGLLRYPVRAVVGSAVLLACGFAVAASMNLPDGVGWVLAVPLGLVVFLAIGVWCDGVRQGVASAGTPTLYGRTPTELALVASIAPFVAALVLGGIGAAMAIVSFGAPIAGLAWWCALVVFSVVLRVFDAAKGPLPIGLLMPVSTPVGDVSHLNVLLWQSDAVLLALVVGGGLTAFAPTIEAFGYVWLLAATLIVGLIASYRLQKLSAPA
jgi:hypothetical protein